MKTIVRFLKRHVFLFVLILICLVLYLKTLRPTVCFHDCGELQTAICTLGIAHPPGYPTYVVLGKVFTLLLPIKSVAWRVNFMSAFFSIATLALFFLINKKILRTEVGSFIAALVVAFSNNYWKFSITAEMYSLNDFFMLLFLYFVLFTLKLNDSEKACKYYIFFFLLGVAQGNHRSITIISPLLVAYLFFKNPKFFLEHLKQTFLMVFFFVLGISIYLFLPTRASQGPYLNYARPTTWENFKYLVTAKQFSFLMFSVPVKELVTEKLVIFWQLLREQFFVPGIVLSILGIIWYVYRKKYETLALVLFIFLLNTFVWLEYGVKDFYRYLNPSFIMVGFFIAAGIKALLFLFSSVRKIKTSYFLRGLVMCSLFYFVLFLAKKNYTKVDLSEKKFALEWGTEVMGTLDRDAVIISHWAYSAPLWYLQGCEGLRPDIVVADDRVIIDEGWRSRIETIRRFIDERPVYLTSHRPHLEEAQEAEFEVQRENNIYRVTSN